MARERLTDAVLQARLQAALAIEDPAARRRAANKVRRSIAALEYRSTLGSGPRLRLQAR